jgi:hypothetical protein
MELPDANNFGVVGAPTVNGIDADAFGMMGKTSPTDNGYATALPDMNQGYVVPSYAVGSVGPNAINNAMEATMADRDADDGTVNTGSDTDDTNTYAVNGLPHYQG